MIDADRALEPGESLLVELAPVHLGRARETGTAALSTHNRSSEELAMRDLVEAWGRKRWPEARVIHELKMEPCRCDLAFVLPNDLIAVEIKSSKDKLDRLQNQMETFALYATKVYLAIAPKWHGAREIGYSYDVLTVNDIVTVDYVRRSANWRCYTTMLDILWAEEARRICRRHSFDVGSKSPLGHTLPQLAANLSGKQIVAEVCRELRARPTLHKADDPIELSTAVITRIPGTVSLL